MSKQAKRAKTSKKGPARASGKAKSASSNTAAARGSAVTATIRSYCQGIGDCRLLRFPRKTGGDFWMLIDCGIHRSVTGGPGTIDKIVDNIASLTGKLDVIVMTHEHWDHISGFKSAQEKFSHFAVDQIWMPWMENPEDLQALEFDKFKTDAADVLVRAAAKMSAMSSELGLKLTDHLSAIQNGVGTVLGFNFGAKGEKVREARTALVGLLNGKSKPIYREPKQEPFEIGVPNLRIYVLGPPRETKMFGITERPSELYHMRGDADSAMVRALKDPIEVCEQTKKQWDDFTSPFDYNEGFCLADLLDECKKAPELGPFKGLTAKQKNELFPDQSNAGLTNRQKAQSKDKMDRCVAAQFLYDYYAGPEAAAEEVDPELDPEFKPNPNQSVRRIDGDWLGVAADLAIQLDSRTNNSSLVLAFEFVDTGRVMLFVGDVQVGNWLSWKDVKWKMEDKVVTAHELLGRTAFYKVGHHGSHNATLKANGLELMVHPDLAAFIPTNKEDAKHVGWGEMPFDKLLQALEKSASSRVVRADDDWLKSGGQPPFKAPSGAIKRFDWDKGADKLWVEFDIA